MHRVSPAEVMLGTRACRLLVPRDWDSYLLQLSIWPRQWEPRRQTETEQARGLWQPWPSRGAAGYSLVPRTAESRIASV